MYHICPTASNFQFDTTFMYLIAVLVFLKIYQFRHADLTLTAHLVFLIIGVALTIEAVGYYTSHWAFWGLFILCYIIFMLVFITKIFVNQKSFRRIPQALRENYTAIDIFTLKTAKKHGPCVFVVLVNIILAVIFGVKQVPGVSRYLLAILMINMMIYELWYICRKLHLR